MPKKQRVPVPTSTVAARIQLRRAIGRFAKAQEEYSWRGAGDPDDVADIEQHWKEAPERLTNAIDVFEAETRADAVKIALADDAAKRKPQPRPGNDCRYCDGSMHFYAEEDAGPCRCAPRPKSTWQHTNGKLYVVVGLSNIAHLRADHPIDVIYKTHVIDGDEAPYWTRRLSDWTRSFIPMPAWDGEP